MKHNFPILMRSGGASVAGGKMFKGAAPAAAENAPQAVAGSDHESTSDQATVVRHKLDEVWIWQDDVIGYCDRLLRNYCSMLVEKVVFSTARHAACIRVGVVTHH